MKGDLYLSDKEIRNIIEGKINSKIIGSPYITVESIWYDENKDHFVIGINNEQETYEENSKQEAQEIKKSPIKKRVKKLLSISLKAGEQEQFIPKKSLESMMIGSEFIKLF